MRFTVKKLKEILENFSDNEIVDFDIICQCSSCRKSFPTKEEQEKKINYYYSVLSKGTNK